MAGSALTGATALPARCVGDRKVGGSFLTRQAPLKPAGGRPLLAALLGAPGVGTGERPRVCAGEEWARSDPSLFLGPARGHRAGSWEMDAQWLCFSAGCGGSGEELGGAGRRVRLPKAR